MTNDTSKSPSRRIRIIMFAIDTAFRMFLVSGVCLVVLISVYVALFHSETLFLDITTMGKVAYTFVYIACVCLLLEFFIELENYRGAAAFVGIAIDALLLLWLWR